MKKRRNISTYLINVMNVQNQLRAFKEIINDKTLVNILLNDLSKSYEIVIQGIILL